ncbi:MAG: SDR family oxidoreductase [Bacteroidota bacterium]
MKNKVVIVTGASSGIGKALVMELMSMNAKVVMASRNKAMLDEIISNVTINHEYILAIETDVTNEEDCKRLIEATINKYGKIDVLINNAGISMRALFDEVSIDVIKKVMDVNFWGTVYCTKYALPHILKSKGSVVGVSSIAGYKGLPGRTGYSASKFAMQGFLEVLRIENIKKGLHVLIACPGFTASNIRKVALSKDGSQQGETPLDESKLMSAEEVSKKIVNAIIKRKNSVIMTSQGKMTVLLNKFFPKLVDKLVYNHMAKEPDSPFK